MTTLDLFADQPMPGPQSLGPGSFLLRGFALSFVEQLLPEIALLEQQAPFRHMVTPGGLTMSVALTNCGELGWVSDRRGYRYSETDPLSGLPWPAMPDIFARLAHEASAEAGFEGFEPDACLVNRYQPDSRLSLHRDEDERSFDEPIVSVSLGMPAVFRFGGLERKGETAKIDLFHGDVLVWGGPDRMRYHGVSPLKHRPHPLLGSQRINFTFRKAG